jgi:hypothetical protein
LAKASLGMRWLVVVPVDDPLSQDGLAKGVFPKQPEDCQTQKPSMSSQCILETTKDHNSAINMARDLFPVYCLGKGAGGGVQD